MIYQSFSSFHHVSFTYHLDCEFGRFVTKFLQRIGQVVVFFDSGQGLFAPHPQDTHIELPRELFVELLQHFVENLAVNAHSVEQGAIDIEYDVLYWCEFLASSGCLGKKHGVLRDLIFKCCGLTSDQSWDLHVGFSFLLLPHAMDCTKRMKGTSF